MARLKPRARLFTDQSMSARHLVAGLIRTTPTTLLRLPQAGTMLLRLTSQIPRLNGLLNGGRYPSTIWLLRYNGGTQRRRHTAIIKSVLSHSRVKTWVLNPT